jgi:ribosome maturation protein Sdo1
MLTRSGLSYSFDDEQMRATLEGSQWRVIMTDPEAQQLSSILKKLRDNQKIQLDRQAEALALQRDHYALIQQQTERHEHIQDRAESIQAKGAQLMAMAHKALFVLLPIVTLLIIYASWLILR